MDYVLSSETIALALTCSAIVIGIIYHHFNAHESLKKELYALNLKQVQIDTLLSVTMDKGERITDDSYRQELKEGGK